ncbi:uncharacterized protein E0L32_003302 [Thyridium curvatum]|uniref:Spc7 kinetochore protein domain-containing protein n=1 Tax=Thyridium curvatum TaxID=1093900 RepID=A0A507BEI1_9PEZI|nr:uncharacterized protein E0L32_003302 [Thyridium curvatum]TPX17184.1 hypothetical protein E0L32_003302 [Thyridium curvatum]
MAAHDDATVPATRRSRKSTTGLSPRKAMDKENATVDVGSTLAAGRKKSRSKSMGPGGLDVLKSGNGNRRVSLAAPSRPPPRSILKPTIPLLPEIPPHKSKRSGGASEAKTSPSSGGGGGGGDDTNGTKIALRTEEEQQAAAREREAKERAALEKEINDRREARRKSLANRRVSFAAEATLHTFHEVEDMLDSTTSTDSTRRASAISARSPAHITQDHAGSDASEPPSTPPEQGEEIVPESPANQRDLHQRKHRRSSGASALDFDNGDDTMTSTVYDSDSEHGDVVEEEHIDEDEASDSDSDSDEGDGTMMTVDGDEMTSASMMSARSDADSTSGLDENLRLAAQNGRQAQPIDEDEEIIPAFAGWGKKSNASSAGPRKSVGASPSESNGEDDEMDMDMDMDVDMDMTSAVGGIIRSATRHEADESEQDIDQTQDMSMDVTRALGGILPQQKAPVPDDSPSGEQTMDLTTAIGGIQKGAPSNRDSFDSQGNEDMSMELTTVLGGVLGANTNKGAKRQNRRRTIKDLENDDATMDMTVAVGKIIPTTKPNGNDEEEEATMGMDMTTALGGIMKPSSPARRRSAARKIMEEEADQPDPASTTTSLDMKASPKQCSPPTKAQEDDNNTQGLSAFRGKGLRRSLDAKGAKSPASAKKVSTPRSAKTTTPSKIGTPQPDKPKTPTRASPPRTMMATRSKSPVSKSTTPRSASKSDGQGSTIFQRDATTGLSTPRVVLTPQRRRLSGLGVDRSGLGSPKVAEMLERRGSIGDTAGDFVVGQGQPARRAVTFEDPRAMEEELDKERQDEEEKENSRRILEREADGELDGADATLNLKEMIQGLSPKKNPLKGRKSLHVGSAKGVLGKRPLELDDDEDAEEADGVKRLKGHQASPVKNVRLQQPPSKAETTGRKTRSRKSLEDPSLNNITPSTARSPTKPSSVAKSPKQHGRFKNVDLEPSTTINFDEHAPVNVAAIQPNENDERIHLQDFLNMTSIRFMELTTTKRRHTVAPSAPNDGLSNEDKDTASLERELKKYIHEGRSIVREIETETFEENPPLFREYMSATPDFRVLMDNQFKNVKTHARLLSKAMWYEWRMKLQEGLREGLVRNAEGMERDEENLQKQRDLLDSVMPGLLKQLEALEREHGLLEEAAQELADCDPADLEGARAELLSVDDDIEQKKKMIAELQSQLQDAETNISRLSGKKQKCLEDIKEADKVREECRGWSVEEISSLKARVDDIEKKHGWAVTGCQNTTVSMTYLREIELVFDASAFQPGQPNSRIDLWYIADKRNREPLPLTPEKEFFLQCIRDRVRGLPQSQTKVSRLLGIVSAGWKRARAVSDNVHLLGLTQRTKVEKTSDSSIAVKSLLVLTPLATKVEVAIHLHSLEGGEGGVEVAVAPQASVVYGEQFNAAKMSEFVATHIPDRVRSREEQKEDESDWGAVALELQERLLARGKK